MPKISRNGVDLAYVEQGAGEPAILLLHGMACVHEHMMPLVDAFAPTHRCVAFDLRGHGESSAPHDAYSADDFGADIAFFIDELGLDRPILIGHSFGGSVALIYARAHPERVRGLVMLDSGLRSRATIGADLNPFYDALRAATPEQYKVIVEDFCMTRLFDPVDDQVVARRIAQQMAQVPAHVFLSMAATVTAFDSADTARACTVPSLIIQSCQPFVDPVELATLPSNWHEGRVVGAGHFIQLLAPDQVIPMVRRFLELAG
ncbi:MAG: alpha/beta hydrolase [Acidimicrobiales bacterium]